MEQILFFSSVVIAVIYGGFFRSTKGSNLGSFLKTTPLVLLAVYVGIKDGHSLLIAALILSALGDLALSRTGQPAFLAGLISFAIAHIMYSLLFAQYFENANTVAAVVLILLCGSSFYWLIPYTKSLRAPVVFYIAIISIMTFFAFSSSINMMVLLGVVAFVISDLMLSIRMFRAGEKTPIAEALNIGVWVFYFGGQLMITLGLLGF